MLSDECVLMLLCHEKENPIEKWKKMIGPMDPVEAKVKKFKNNFRKLIQLHFEQR
jgi:hypothetical protein